MRFLFITKKYPPLASPSGRIVFYLVEELKNRGHNVDVITRDKKKSTEFRQNGNIYHIKDTKWELLCLKVNDINCKKIDKFKFNIIKYIRKIILAIHLLKFPNAEPKLTKDIVKLYQKNITNKKYDYVVGFFRPYSCLDAAMEISKLSGAKCISCYFDLVEEKDCPKFMPKQLYACLIKKGDEKVFHNSKCVMLPESAKQLNNNLLDEYKDKILYYNFPTFIKSKNQSSTIKKDDNILRFMFAGTLNSDYRNPYRMLGIVNEFAKTWDTQVQLDIYGNCNCIEIIENFDSVDNFTINYNGLVNKDEIIKAEQNADILINIMNSYAAIVPSKIFELFSLGKPILNIVSEGDDGSMEYFDKYTLCYTAKLEKMDKIIKELNEFVLNNKNKVIDIDEIGEIYKKNTPSYVINQILEFVEE